MRERIGVVGAILQRLAEREIEMETMFCVDVRTNELRAHRRDLVVVETEGLEIGETPVRLSEAGIERDAAPVGGDGFVLTPAVFSAWPWLIHTRGLFGYSPRIAS